MKCKEAKRMKLLEDEHRWLKQLVTDQALDIQMHKHLWEGIQKNVFRGLSCMEAAKLRPASGSLADHKRMLWLAEGPLAQLSFLSSNPANRSMTLEELFGPSPPTIQILDIGAMLEGQERYQPLLARGVAQVTGFEPNPEQYAKLQGRQGPYRYLPYFLGSGAVASFQCTRYPGCSSLLEPDPAVIDLFETIAAGDPAGNFHVQHRTPVETARLDDIAEAPAPDYLKIDVQGFELEVLRHAKKALASTLVLESEVEFLPLYKGQPLFGDLQCYLREQGFVLHKLIDVAGRPLRPFRPANPFLPMSQILWADAIFVRDYTQPTRWSADELLKAAIILDQVYGSYDLAYHLIAERDRRNGSNVAESYAKALGSRQLHLRCLNLKDHP